MKLLICRCRGCRMVRRRKEKGSDIHTYRKRAARHLVKQLIKMGLYDDLPTKIKTDYDA